MTTIREPPRKLRSRISNHTDLLPEITDGRSSAARRFRDLVAAFISDSGGLDRCSEIRINLLRRLAATTVAAEQLESKSINGGAIDLNQLCTLASTAARISQRLGLERMARDVSPSLGDLLRADLRQGGTSAMTGVTDGCTQASHTDRSMKLDSAVTNRFSAAGQRSCGRGGQCPASARRGSSALRRAGGARA
jgi:hypothetical protein